MSETAKGKFLKNRISAMSIELKVGQCFVLGFQGTIITPNILHRIRDFYPAGIRTCCRFRLKDSIHDPGCTPPEFKDRMYRKPGGTIKDFVRGINSPYYTNEEYTEVLNTLKQAALDSDLGHPLHITFDFEGDMHSDYAHGNTKFLPAFRGIAKTGDPQMGYDWAKAVCDQVVPIGFGWTHSLVLDVNTNPMNPEIGNRSLGDNPEVVIEFGKAILQGYKDGGIIATGKHFPGRGHSDSDAHHGLPVVDLSEKELRKGHIAPYKALIESNLPAVMTAHTLYPNVEPQDVPATLSKKFLTEILKDELGFKGCVTTDALGMGGIVSRYEVKDAAVMALNAGCDLLLVRDEGGIVEEVIPAVVGAVRKGLVPEERIDDALTRSLGVKYDYGYFGDNPLNGIKDPARASDGINSSQVADTARMIASRALEVLRNDDNVMPIKPETKVLLIEQVPALHVLSNNKYCHPPVLWQKMFARSENVGCVEVKMEFTKDDRNRVRARLDDYDVVVITSYYGRAEGWNEESGFVEEIAACGKPVIVVTNSPFPFTVKPGFRNVIVTYGVSPECLDEAAKAIYGRR
jgi:beta-N-acetylhexosaminidase